MISFSVDDATHVAEIVLDNTAALNALNDQAVADLGAAVEEIAGLCDQGVVRAVLVRGQGRAFCAGRDIAGVDPATDDALAYLEGAVTPVLKALSALPVPVFAAVQGACLGVGLGLAIACDIVYVGQKAKVGSPFKNLGCTLDSGGHYLLVERLGYHRAMDLIVSGELISGVQAVEAGLFSRVVADEELLEVTRAAAVAAASGPTAAFAASKQIVAGLRDRSLGLWESMSQENRLQADLCANTQDYAEGFRAFQEKRAPHFSGS